MSSSPNKKLPTGTGIALLALLATSCGFYLFLDPVESRLPAWILFYSAQFSLYAALAFVRLKDGLVPSAAILVTAPAARTLLVHLGVLDEKRGLSGSRVSSLQVESFDRIVLTTSPIVLHAGARRTDEPGGVTDSLGIFFFVYGARAGLGTGQPRVTAQYRFQLDGKEKAQTQPKLLAATDAQAVASDEISLKSFVPGEYRVTVLVTDEIAGQSVERRAGFRVIP